MKEPEGCQRLSDDAECGHKHPVDKEAVVKRGLVAAMDTADIVDNIVVDLRNTNTYQSKGYLSLGDTDA